MALKDMVLNIAKGVVQTVAINTAVTGLPHLGGGLRKAGRAIKNSSKAILDRAEMRKDIQDFEAAASKTEKIQRTETEKQTNDLENLVAKSEKAQEPDSEESE